MAITAPSPQAHAEAQEIGRGLFITLEGGEGAGKSVQAEALVHRIEAQGRTHVLTREPGGTPLSERLRDILLGLAEDYADETLDHLTETFLFIAARAELVSRIIAPALERGHVVICDRFADSTRAYQAFGRGVDLAIIDQLNAVATHGISPDLTVLLDVPVEEGLARTGTAGQADRFGSEEYDFHERVRQGYLSLAEEEPNRWLVVDASQPLDAVTDAIWFRLEPLL